MSVIAVTPSRPAAGTLILREATEADAPTVVFLVHAAFAEYRGVLDPPPAGLSETPESVRAQMAAGTRVLLALRAGRPVGCVFATPQPREGWVHLGRFSVHPACQGQGVGNALISAVETHARADGYTGVRLNTRAAFGEKRAWYERLGYRVRETSGAFLVMEKDLTNREGDLGGNGDAR